MAKDEGVSGCRTSEGGSVIARLKGAKCTLQ